MKRLGQTLQVGLFFLFLLSGSLLMLLFGEHETVSEAENRTLAPLPPLTLRSLQSGEYLRGLENYSADHFAFRDPLAGAGKRLAYWYGLQSPNQAILVSSGANNTGAAQTVRKAAEPEAVSGPAPAKPGGGKEFNSGAGSQGQSPSPKRETKPHVTGKVLIWGDKAMNLFAYQEEAEAAYAETVNRFHAAMSRKNNGVYAVRTSVLVAPTAVEFVPPDELKTMSDSQQTAIGKLYKLLDPSIHGVDIIPSLLRQKDKQLYFRTDHHWTATGAYYAYTAYMDSLGLNPAALNDFQAETVPGFLGSLYSATRNGGLAKHQDTIVLYKPTVSHKYTVHYTGPLIMNLLDMSHASKKNKYRIFLSGDRPWGLIETPEPGGRKIAVIKDSYGNAFVPFLVQKHYREIYVIDPRQFEFNLPDFIEKYDIHEVLFLNNAEVLMNPGFAEVLGKCVSGTGSP